MGHVRSTKQGWLRQFDAFVDFHWVFAVHRQGGSVGSNQEVAAAWRGAYWFPRGLKPVADIPSLLHVERQRLVLLCNREVEPDGIIGEAWPGPHRCDQHDERNGSD